MSRVAQAELEAAQRRCEELEEALAHAESDVEQLLEQLEGSPGAEVERDPARRGQARGTSRIDVLERALAAVVAAHTRAPPATAVADGAAADRAIERLGRVEVDPIADVEDARERLPERIGDFSTQSETARRVAAELRLATRELERAVLVAGVVELERELGATRVDRDIAEAIALAAERRLRVLAQASEHAGGTTRELLLDVSRSTELAWLSTELEARARIAHEYATGAAVLSGGRDAMAPPAPEDHRDVLLAGGEPDPVGRPRVDVIVCVHNALDDVRMCIWSLVEKTEYPFHLILVDDGSDADTAAYLDQVASVQPKTTLIRRSELPRGYTVAANTGLRAATGDYLILLNSDTIVTPSWIDRIVDCGESDGRIGIVGPLSNAASHQSIPDLRTDGAWATNPLPSFVTADGIALLLERISDRLRPRVPFINGFCYAIKRPVIDAIGYLDEECFASGYCEENDFSHRASEAGFELAVADDGYIYHAKSKSFTVEGRTTIAKHNYQVFLHKHGEDTINAKVAALESDTSLSGLRAIAGEALSSPEAFASALELDQTDPLSVVFVLPGLGEGGSGGSHSIYQEVCGLRRLGIPARIALAESAWPRAVKAYDDADEVFETYADLDQLTELTADADVISATHFKSVELVAELRNRRTDFLAAYYIQDYEPFFMPEDAADIAAAQRSYTMIDDCLLFAKTHWLCRIVADRHRRYVAKVEPSIDERLFVPREAPGASEQVRVAAMVRPRTPRRQPSATVAVLDSLGAALGDRVELTTFGCSPGELQMLGVSQRLSQGHRGLLTRAQVADLLGGIDVFLDLSMYQAFGRTALEAMACGSTAVVPRLGGVWEFVEQGVNAIAVDALDPRGALDALTDLCEDRVRVGEMKLAARATAQRYSTARAALSEYLVFKREHVRRVARAGDRT